MSLTNSITDIIPVIRGLIDDKNRVDGRDSFFHETDDTFTLTEDFISEPSIKVFQDSILLPSLSYSYDSDTNQITIPSLTPPATDTLRDTKLQANFNGIDGQTNYTAETGQVLGFSQNAELDTAFKRFGTSSLKLDGIVNDAVILPTSPDLNLFASATQNWTIDLWFRRNSTNVNDGFIGETDGSNNNWWALYLSGGNTKFFAKISGVFEVGITGTFVINDTNWHHLTMVKKGDEWAVYLDGIQDSYVQSNFTGTVASTSLSIGTFGTTALTDFPLDGNIDSLRITKSNIFNASPNVGITDIITIPLREGSGDEAILIQYDYFKKYSDTEIQGYLQSALAYFPMYQYKKTFEVNDNNKVVAINGVDPTIQELYILAQIASILIDPQNVKIAIPDLSMSAKRDKSDQEQIKEVFTHFKNFVGSFDFEV